MATPEEDAAIAKLWPAEWAIANDSNRRNRSNARRKLRKAFREYVKLQQFKRNNPNARCANCNHLIENPTVGLTGTYCLLDSDFHGYMTTEPEDVCARHKEKQ